VEEIVGVVFQYINMLRREAPQEWVFEELKSIARIDFPVCGGGGRG